jgi:hypothetical protein
VTRRHLIAALALAALAVAGALAANLVLIGLATDRRDPVGRLRPVVAVGPATGAAPTVEAGTTPAPTVDDHADDGHGQDGDEDD